MLPRRCLVVASPSPCRRLAIASPSPCRRLAPPFARHRHHHVRSRRPTRTATAMAIAIGIVGRYPYRGCCHHRRRSSRRRLRCLRHRSPDVSVAPDAPPPLPPSFVTDPTAVRLRLAMIPRQRRRRRRRRRRSATDAMAPTPGAAWTTPSSAWRTGSSSARSSQRRRAPLRWQWGVRRSQRCQCL